MTQFAFLQTDFPEVFALARKVVSAARGTFSSSTRIAPRAFERPEVTTYLEVMLLVHSPTSPTGKPWQRFHS